MRVLLIGGTGHVGTFLSEKLLQNGHEVYIGTRGETWARSEKARDGATFLKVNATDKACLAALKEYRFDAVVDFPGTAHLVWDALEGEIGHLVACGSLWMLGAPCIVPTPETEQGVCPFTSYAARFEKIKEMSAASGRKGTAFTAILPPNICGPGKVPLDQWGGRSVMAHRAMSAGETVTLPDGAECLIAPCDAEDIATLFLLALENKEKSAGEIFNVGSGNAMTVSAFIDTYARIYGVTLPIKRVSWEEYKTTINPDMGAWWHFYAHMCPDISKAERVLGYKAKYTSEQAMARAVQWMKEQKIL
jgi:nucleoside-diphosphate-sugar epimerase